MNTTADHLALRIRRADLEDWLREHCGPDAVPSGWAIRNVLVEWYAGAAGSVAIILTRPGDETPLTIDPDGTIRPGFPPAGDSRAAGRAQDQCGR